MRLQNTTEGFEAQAWKLQRPIKKKIVFYKAQSLNQSLKLTALLVDFYFVISS